MSVCQKLMEARVKLAEANLKKSGHNKFAGYYYYELGDFLPTAMKIFCDLKLYGGVSYGRDVATLTIVDTEKPESTDHIFYYCPMSTAELKGCHPVQNLGAVQTYIRRYLWTAALELVEHDAIDASEPAGIKKSELETVEKKVAKPIEAPKKEPLGPIAEAKDLTNEKPKDETPQKPWTITLKSDTALFVPSFVESAQFTLQFAKSEEDVKEIFRVNKFMFDELKRQSVEQYDALMVAFKTRKNDLIKE